MKNSFNYLIIILFSMTLFACGGGGGDGDGSTNNNSFLPADATTITTANASTVARSATDNVVSFEALTDLRQTESSSVSTGDVVRLVFEKAFNRNRQIASRTETQNCGESISSGTITVDVEETQNSASGTVSFIKCDLGGGVIDGNFIFDSTLDQITGVYTSSGKSSLTIRTDTESITVTMDYDGFGNNFSGDFSVSYTFSITGSGDANYRMTTTTPITGVHSNVTGGEILVEGAESTRLKITVTGANVADVFLDDGSGTFVFHSTINI